MTNSNKNNVSRQDTQATKMRIGLVIVSAFLAHCVGTWAYTFFIMIRQGEVAFCEPNKPWVVAEFGLAVAFTLVGLSFLGMVIWETLRNKKLKRSSKNG